MPITIIKAISPTKKERTIETSTNKKYKMYAVLIFILPEGNGRSGLFILSIAISVISFIILPEAITREAAKAAMNTFNPGDIRGRQIIADTITEIKVMRKFIGRKSCTAVKSCSVKSVDFDDERFAETYEKNLYLVFCI